MALSYNLGYQESISVHLTRRQIFAGKPYFTFWNIWEWVIFWTSWFEIVSFPQMITILLFFLLSKACKQGWCPGCQILSDFRANSNVTLSGLKYNIHTLTEKEPCPKDLFPGKHFVDWDNKQIIFRGAAHSHITTYQKPIYFVLKVKLWKGRIFQTNFYALEVKLFNILYSRM